METLETPEPKDKANVRFGVAKRIRHELSFEALLVVAGFLLAFGLTTKIILAIVITCFRFAIPDCISALLVLRFDPDRWHGIAVALLFTALGLTRASIFAFVVLIASISIGMSLGGPPGQLGAAGLGTGFICAYGCLAAVFPLALAAAAIAWKTQKKLEFAAGLTQLRRNKHKDPSEISLDIWKGLKFVGIASAVSLTVITIIPLTVIPNILFLIAAFVAPFVWMPIFWNITFPQH